MIFQLVQKPSGAVAQLGARVNGIHEVAGSIPASSTKYKIETVTGGIEGGAPPSWGACEGAWPPQQESERSLRLVPRGSVVQSPPAPPTYLARTVGPFRLSRFIGDAKRIRFRAGLVEWFHQESRFVRVRFASKYSTPIPLMRLPPAY